MACVQGSVIDSYVIGANPPPPPPPPPILYVDRGNASCSDSGSGTSAQPFCTINAAASRVVAGQTVLVSSGTYNERVTVSSSGTATAPIIFAAAPGTTPTVTGGTSGFYLSGRTYVTVQGFNVTGTSDDGIVTATDGTTAIVCELEDTSGSQTLKVEDTKAFSVHAAKPWTFLVDVPYTLAATWDLANQVGCAVSNGSATTNAAITLPTVPPATTHRIGVYAVGEPLRVDWVMLTSP